MKFSVINGLKKVRGSKSEKFTQEVNDKRHAADGKRGKINEAGCN